MENILLQIQQCKSELETEKVNNAADLEAVRIKYLGSKGLVKTIMSSMKDVAVEKKREAGQLLNEFKIFVEQRFQQLQETTSSFNTAIGQGIDVSLPGPDLPLGTRHPKISTQPVFLQTLQPLPPQIRQLISISALGSVKGK